MKDFTQIFIAALGIPAIVLIGRKDRRLRKWGYIFGLAGQPFWVWSSFAAGQWGILILGYALDSGDHNM